MTERMRALLDALSAGQRLSEAQYRELIDGRTDEIAAELAARADRVRRAAYGDAVFIRGLIEISSICRNDCLYCGIRRSNKAAQRYRLTKEEILSACRQGDALGFRTFVLQGGEDPHFTDAVVCDIVRAIKAAHPDCAVTLSLGERSDESYAALREAGADRYLLRHETACPRHYAQLHPEDMAFDNRMRCLRTLKRLGYQTGCGFMVGSPGQTSAELAKDLAFIADFQPEMVGVGPFIPHRDTPFAGERAGTVELTCYLLSIIRLLCPRALLPATTALATLSPDGRAKGLAAGANVVMPNLSPESVRGKYALYDGKKATGDEAAEGLALLKKEVAAIGYSVAEDRGDYRENI